MTDSTRAAFERWATTEASPVLEIGCFDASDGDYLPDDVAVGDYREPSTRQAWTVWQASLASAAGQPGALADVLANLSGRLADHQNCPFCDANSPGPSLESRDHREGCPLPDLQDVAHPPPSPGVLEKALARVETMDELAVSADWDNSDDIAHAVKKACMDAIRAPSNAGGGG